MSERRKERAKEGKKASLCNKEMDTWVSPGRQQHVTHYRQRLEKSRVPVTKSPYENKHSSSEAQNSSKLARVNKHRHSGKETTMGQVN